MIQITDNNAFHLQTNNTSYVIKVLESGHIGQLYYGRRIHNRDTYDSLYSNFSRDLEVGTAYSKATKGFTLESTRLEVGESGKGDYREPSVRLVYEDGTRTTDFNYQDHHLYTGKEPLEGLPATFCNEDSVQTLDITLKDEVADVELVISYSVFEEADVITRSAKIINGSKQPIRIEKLMSMNFDIHGKNFDIMTLDGRWVKECNINRRPLSKGTFYIDSKRGVSSSEHNPFMALLSNKADELTGDVYGFGLIYSGNHKAAVELSSLNIARIQMGISDHDFTWDLECSESFQTPEVVMTFSHMGLGQMSRNFHKIIEHNLVQKQWQNKIRPVLINNWEATYFDFDEKKLMALAKEAVKLGIELFVLDDGWFGRRNDSTSSLGDWDVNLKKLPSGLKKFGKNLNKMGLDFGLWVEPEMVSINSDLYRSHPEWAIQIPGRQPSLGRTQLVLDLSREDVVDYLYNKLSDLFRKSKVSYVKWDMNRNFSDLYSPRLDSKHQQEQSHRYVLGLYNLLERLTNEFPQILFESCASGGNRFDMGMLYYMPQTWTSDNTDAVERMDIQYGTSILYPLSTMGAHVSDSPSSQVLRQTPLETRFNVAAFGLLGYELDLTKLNAFEKKVIKKQITYYKKHRQLLQFGHLYRIQSPFDDNIMQWMVVNEEKTEALFGYYQKLQQTVSGLEQMRMVGLNADSFYKVTAREMSMNIRQFGNLINEVLPVKIKAHSIPHTILSNHYEFKTESEEVSAYGSELMYAGMALKAQYSSNGYNEDVRHIGDFGSRVYYVELDKSHT